MPPPPRKDPYEGLIHHVYNPPPHHTYEAGPPIKWVIGGNAEGKCFPERKQDNKIGIFCEKSSNNFINSRIYIKK